MTRAAQGLRAWLMQRFTAIYLGVFLVAVFASIAGHEALDYARWHSWFAQPWMGVTTALFAVALLLHAWVGIRDVLIDYIHPVWLRLLLMALFGLVLLGSLLWIVRALTLAAVAG